MTTEELIATRRVEPQQGALRKSKKNKERASIPCVKMNKLNPEYRSYTRLGEVSLGLTKEQVMQEAGRCLDCPSPTCMRGCPVNIDIPTSIKNIERGEFLEAVETLKEISVLPAACGRVCPQEKQCESKCIHLEMGREAVIISYLERFAADYERESGNTSVPEIAEKNGIKIAVVSPGPAGLSFARDMAKRGYDVTMFEALYETGGVLECSILESRLPNKIVDAEIDGLRKMGVQFERDCIADKTISHDDLHADGLKDVFTANGTGLPNFMNIPSENFMGVIPSNEYLIRVNLTDAANLESDTPVLQGKKVAVIGGGNTAMDSVCTVCRSGAERAMTVYRCSEEEMSAHLEEVKHAKEEGMEFLILHNPIEYIGDEKGRVRRIRLQKMELDEPDVSGRCCPVSTEGVIETIDVDEVIVSVGVSPNPLIPRVFGGLGTSRKGAIVVEEDGMCSTLGDMYVGGNIIRGRATVVPVMGDGRKAAAAMDAGLKGKV